MRVFFTLLLSFSLLFGVTLDKKIKQSKRALSAKKIEYKKMDRELSKVAKKIIAAKKEQKALASKLAKLSKKIKSNEAEFIRLQKEEQSIANELKSINKQISKKQKKFVDLVAKNFSLALALDEIKQPTPDSIMMKEVYELYAKRNEKEINALKREIDQYGQKKESLQLKKSHIEKLLAKYKSERDEYRAKKEKKDKLVKALARDRAIYKKRFEKIKASRKKLERQLAKLKIIKRNNAKAAQKRAEAKRSVATKRANIASSSGSYKGKKTISPLKGGRLIKKYGTYIDPIYKFKIFNKSITLKAPYVGAKVRSVLPGKVVFAENSGGMLGKVVIVEHSDGLHTIYAKLSRLAPGIRVGKKLSRGTIIGKVNKTLMFEVTKNNKHINPVHLIRL